MTRAKFLDIPANDLILHPMLQLRTEGTSVDHIADLQDALRKKAKLPEPKVWKIDGMEGYHVTDGFHCASAMLNEGRKSIRCRVTHGTWEDARLDAAGANHHDTAALKRTSDDKRASVLCVLETLAASGKRWGISRIAEHCGVSQALAKAVSDEFASYAVDESKPPEPVYIEKKDGTKQKAKVGKRLSNERRTKAGAEVPGYDWRAFEAAMGVVQRAPDDAARGTDLAGTVEYQGVCRLLGELAEAFEKFKKKASKSKEK
jgi:hypothetical protein